MIRRALKNYVATFKTRAGRNSAHRLTGVKKFPIEGPDDPQRMQFECSCGWKSPVRTSGLVAQGDWQSHLWEIANQDLGK